MFNEHVKRASEGRDSTVLNFVPEEEIMQRKFTGECWDELINPETGEVVETHGWNIVVDSASILIAALMKGEPGYTGISYWEVGTGNSTWNNQTPPNPSSSDRGLLTPLFRKAVPTSAIKFVNADGAESASPSNRIEITVTFGTAEANGELREFAIFGGNATTTLGSGIMINRKTHGLITKTAQLELKRTIRFTF